MRAIIPLIPAMRPLNSISNTAASPINTPPMVEATGVNGVIVAMAVMLPGRAASFKGSPGY